MLNEHEENGAEARCMRHVDQLVHRGSRLLECKECGNEREWSGYDHCVPQDLLAHDTLKEAACRVCKPVHIARVDTVSGLSICCICQGELKIEKSAWRCRNMLVQGGCRGRDAWTASTLSVAGVTSAPKMLNYTAFEDKQGRHKCECADCKLQNREIICSFCPRQTTRRPSRNSTPKYRSSSGSTALTNMQS